MTLPNSSISSGIGQAIQAAGIDLSVSKRQLSPKDMYQVTVLGMRANINERPVPVMVELRW